ncbi:hypothetical protein [Streptomyces sp.]|uniref:hypothetical protein n=1 Tax=Streptomyces sp. TaxID=1931 RepID=UPI002F927355
MTAPEAQDCDLGEVPQPRGATDAEHREALTAEAEPTGPGESAGASVPASAADAVDVRVSEEGAGEDAADGLDGSAVGSAPAADVPTPEAGAGDGGVKRGARIVRVDVGEPVAPVARPYVRGVRLVEASPVEIAPPDLPAVQPVVLPLKRSASPSVPAEESQP